MLPAFILVIWSLVGGHVGGSHADPRTFSTEAECQQALVDLQKKDGGWVLGSCLPASIVR